MTDLFSTDTVGLTPATAPEVVRLGDGDRFSLRISPVANRIGDDVLRMLAYNGSVPGPCLHVDQGSEIVVDVTNAGDVEATVHWHGLRLENRYDGVPHETQAPIPIGGTFTYRLQFPDAGFYWYHPHIREDFGLEMGLYGTIVVEPADAGYWPAVDRHLTITVDDLLVEHGRIAPFHRSGPTHTAMGRYGNVMLTNGQPWFSGRAAVGEVVRLYLVNTANTRIFNLALPGARMKLVGGDSGRYERETFVEEVLLAPSERAVVDVSFDTVDDVRIEHRTPGHTYVLGAFSVAGKVADGAAEFYDDLRTDPELTAEHGATRSDLDREPDKILGFTALMPLLYGGDPEPASAYACPMHPDVVATEAGTCPRCHMHLQAVREPSPTAYTCPMHPEVTGGGPETCPRCGMRLVRTGGAAPAGPEHGDHHAGVDTGDGLEWEDLMPDINRQTDTTNMVWKLVDRQTGAENGAINWSFTVGDRVKIRLVNEMEGSEHPMHHPFHVHGAGRFLVLAREGVPEENLVWKDTVLLPAGHTVDILLDVSNPGLWMAHCHIAEHAQSGMMFSFDVARVRA
jgi:FtsP/CotA-like multicopper oxidase with cupredoxin domain